MATELVVPKSKPKVCSHWISFSISFSASLSRSSTTLVKGGSERAASREVWSQRVSCPCIHAENPSTKFIKLVFISVVNLHNLIFQFHNFDFGGGLLLFECGNFLFQTADRGLLASGINGLTRNLFRLFLDSFVQVVTLVHHAFE